MTLFGYSLSNLLTYEILGNTVQVLLTAIGWFIIFLIAFKILRTVVFNRLTYLAKKTKSKFDDKIAEIIQKISPLFFCFLAAYLALNTSPILNEKAEKIFDAIFLIIIVYEIIKAAQEIIAYGLKKWNESDKKPLTETTLHGVSMVIKIVLWITGILVVLSNLGFNISALAASLGIGGIAIALAAQNILGDLFSSFSIYFDRPFQIGDFIVVGTDKGTVKKIGLKTTRIQTLHGEELVISNNELTGARVQNYKKMKRRRITFEFGVTYDTKTEKMKKIPGIVKDIIEEQKLAEYDRVHFFSFGDFALIFSVVYYMNSSNYNDYMDAQQTINFAIKEQFEKEGIEMAFPTQTVYVKNT